jgi:hypothetical protein
MRKKLLNIMITNYDYYLIMQGRLPKEIPEATFYRFIKEVRVLFNLIREGKASNKVASSCVKFMKMILRMDFPPNVSNFKRINM